MLVLLDSVPSVLLLGWVSLSVQVGERILAASMLFLVSTVLLMSSTLLAAWVEDRTSHGGTSPNAGL